MKLSIFKNIGAAVGLLMILSLSSLSAVAAEKGSMRVAFGDVPGYEPEKHFAVKRLMPIAPREIIVLRRSD